MLYIKLFKIFENNMVDRKIQLLKDLSVDLEDAGCEVTICNGCNLGENIFSNSKIYIFISNKNIKNIKKLINCEYIKEFEETLKSFVFKCNKDWISGLFREDKVFFSVNKRDNIGNYLL